MPDTYTGNYNFTLPELGASRDTWGEKLNANTRELDQILKSLADRLSDVEDGSQSGMLGYMGISAVHIVNIGAGTGSAYIQSLRVRTGWIACRGQTIYNDASWRAVFPHIGRLHQDLINTGYPYGRDTDGNPKLPDPRGGVIRAFDNGAGRDPDGNRGLGSLQGDAFASHSHSASTGGAGGHSHSGSTDTQGHHSHSGSTDWQGNHTHSIESSRAYDNGGGRRQTVGWGQDYARATGDWGAIKAAGNHNHNLNINAAGNHTHNLNINSVGNHTHSVTVNANGATETRMKNICFVLCMRV